MKHKDIFQNPPYVFVVKNKTKKGVKGDLHLLPVHFGKYKCLFLIVGIP